MLFLATTDEELLRAVGLSTWTEQLGGLPLATTEELVTITDDLLERGHLDRDGEMVFVGPEAERRYGRRHFLELLSAFTADPQFTVLHGRSDVGTVDPIVLTRSVAGPRLVSPGGGRGRSTTSTGSGGGLCRAEHSQGRVVVVGLCAAAVVGADRRDAARAPGRRAAGGGPHPGATTRLAVVREEHESAVDDRGSVLGTWRNGQQRWWTWAGARANALLHAAIEVVDPTLVDRSTRFDDRFVRLRGDATASAVQDTLALAAQRFGDDLAGVHLPIEEEALRQLKFSDLLPAAMAAEVVSARGVDLVGAARVRDQRIVGRHAPE